MKRRSFLGWMPPALSATVLLAEGWTTKRPALALGGALPTLNAPAPAFQLGGVAPSASAPGASEVVSFSLEDFAGRWLVLYFYPKDFTSGCTLEARGFQRDLEAYRQRQAEVVGISTDTLDSHGSFCGEEGLAYPLLSDPRGAVSRLYGSWLAPSALRHTFLIDPQGVLRARWVAVRPLHHSQEVLEALNALQAA